MPVQATTPMQPQPISPHVPRIPGRHASLCYFCPFLPLFLFFVISVFFPLHRYLVFSVFLFCLLLSFSFCPFSSFISSLISALSDSLSRFCSVLIPRPTTRPIIHIPREKETLVVAQTQVSREFHGNRRSHHISRYKVASVTDSVIR